ncbi:uncharacterized protein LOC120469093 isoform X1 [Pimephales promelas]|uniref:uncharacterized protein LOC120469093 isoform X1 n=1 Tax=Pimephales promelas TaxID=90988 RepID=UPI001955C272|nr:uncharacterized protein LOC120469093 isoform X1 [Pimephales promelas]
MKLILFLLVLLKNGMNPAEGLRANYSSEQIILNYSFDPIFNSYGKVCCKFDESVCSTFVNNSGQYTPLYRGRIFINNYNGEFEVRITDLSVMDTGMYSCGFSWFPKTFESVEVTFSDLSGVTSAPLWPKSSIKPDVWPSSPSTPIVSENDAEKLSCRTSIILLAGFSLMVFAAVLAILLVFFLKNRKKQSKDTSGTCSSLNTSLITQVQYINFQGGVQYQIPQQLVMESQDNQIQMNHGQIAQDEYENDDSAETSG